MPMSVFSFYGTLTLIDFAPPHKFKSNHLSFLIFSQSIQDVRSDGLLLELLPAYLHLIGTLVGGLQLHQLAGGLLVRPPVPRLGGGRLLVDVLNEGGKLRSHLITQKRFNLFVVINLFLVYDLLVV